MLLKISNFVCFPIGFIGAMMWNSAFRKGTQDNYDNLTFLEKMGYLDKFKKEDGFAESFGTLWIWYGPKATLPDEGYVAVVNTHKFITGKVPK